MQPKEKTGRAHAFFSCFERRNNFPRLLKVSVLSVLSVLIVPPLMAQSLPAGADSGRVLQDLTSPMKVDPLSPAPRPSVQSPIKVTGPKGAESISFILQGIKVDGSSVYAGGMLEAELADRLGATISVAEIFDFANSLTAKYRNDGYLLSRVVVPEQEIKNGEVILRVVEGYVSEILVEGVNPDIEHALRRYVDKLLEERPLTKGALERYLLLANDLPGLSVKSFLKPALQGEGAATLTLVTDEKRASYWSRSDNRGGDFVGPYQLELGAAFAGVPKVGQSLSIRGIVTPAQRDELNLLSAVYQTKIGTEGASFVLAGNGLKSEPGKSLKSLELKSRSYGLNGSLNFVPIRSRERNLNLRLGFSYANSDTETLGADFSQDRTRSINAGAEYRFLDRWRGANSLSLSANRGVNLLEPTKDGNVLLARADAVSSATWFRGSLARLQSFDAVIHGVSAQVEVDGQFSIDPLTSSREFGVGGLANASAFDSSEITGDHGLSGRIELRYSTNIPAADEIVPGGLLRGTGLQMYTFGDGGYVWQEGDAVTGQVNDKIGSAGLGLRINFGQHLSANVEAAQPFGQVVASKGNKDPRIFGQIVARF